MSRLRTLQHLVPWLARRDFSSSPVIFGMRVYVPHPQKTRSIGPRILGRFSKLEMERQKKRIARNKAGKSPSEVIAEDVARRRNYQHVLKQKIAMAMVTPELKPKLIGKGIQITKIYVTGNFRETRVYWSTTQQGEDEDGEIERALKECAPIVQREAEAEAEAETEASLGKVPKIVFMKDLDFITASKLDKQFSQVEELREQHPEEVSDEEERAHILKCRLDELCLETKLSDVHRLKRTEILNQILSSIEKGKASHRISWKPGLDVPPPKFTGYLESERDGDERKEEYKSTKHGIKKFLANKRKQMERGAAAAAAAAPAPASDTRQRRGR